MTAAGVRKMKSGVQQQGQLYNLRPSEANYSLTMHAASAAWSGTLTLPGLAPFAAAAEVLPGSGTSSGWDVVTQAVAHMGRTDGPALARFASTCPSALSALAELCSAHATLTVVARARSHLQGLAKKRNKWTVSVGRVHGSDDAARGAAQSCPKSQQGCARPGAAGSLAVRHSARTLKIPLSLCLAEVCRSWCADERSKKVVAVECTGGRCVSPPLESQAQAWFRWCVLTPECCWVSRLFLVSPLASPREIVPHDWVAGDLPVAADCLLGVLARRLTPPTAKHSEQSESSSASTDKRAREPSAPKPKEAEKRGGGPKQRQRQAKKRRSAQQQGLLPLTTTLELERLDLHAVLAYRLANLALAEDAEDSEEYDDGRPTIKNISVGAAVDLFWEEEDWYVAVAKKKTGRGILFYYPKEDELEFIAKQKLREYTRKEHIRFLQGDVAAQIAAARAEGEAEADGGDGDGGGADDGSGGSSPRPRRARLEPPGEFVCGEVEMRVGNKLKSMASNLPSADVLRTWNRECQILFWAQRRSFWNGKKLSLLQQACRKHGLYPGGDVPDLKDRLVAREFDPGLLTEDDTQTEEEAAAKRQAALGASDDSDSDSDDAPVFTLLSES